MDAVRRRRVKMDQCPEALGEVWEDFVGRGYYRFQGVGVYEWARCVADVSRSSGALGLLCLQQWIANGFLPEGVDPRPRCGTAIGHLRAPRPDCPRLMDGSVEGTVPWFTGWGFFREAVLGCLDDEGREAYTIIPLAGDERLRVNEPARPHALGSARTVALELCRLPVPPPFRVEPAGTRAALDADSALLAGALLMGCIEAGLDLLQEHPCLDSKLVHTQLARSRSLVDEALKRLREGCSAQRAVATRARLSLHASKLAHVVAVQYGGESLRADHPANLLVREAHALSTVAMLPGLARAVADAAAQT